MSKQAKGAVLIAGGGISGIQAALDLANSGFFVHMVEEKSVIGGKMAQLDKTFPTNDCSMCIISPKLVEVGRHMNISLHTLSQITDIQGDVGDFTVTIHKKPRYVHPDKCIACGLCSEKCPVKTGDEFNAQINKRKAIFLPYPQAVPATYTIDPEKCIFLKKGKCKACEKFCPSGAIYFDDKPQDQTLSVGAVILAPGFTPFDPKKYPSYNYTDHPNIVTSIEFERLLSASGPFSGHLVRPSDHNEPKKVAWLQCVGSRDINKAEHGYCSSVCCMYATKQTIIAKEHTPDLDTSIFFMDMRCFGKDFDKYYERAKNDAGVRYVRARVHTIDPIADDNLRLRYVSENGELVSEEFDMVVLSVGLSPGQTSIDLAGKLGIELNSHLFAQTSCFTPIQTSRKGIYVCGVFQEPKDIPQSVMEASAAAAAASENLAQSRWSETLTRELPNELDVADQTPRIGVFVCNCGINIGGVADVPAVAEYAKGLPNVVHVEENLFTCSQDSQDKMKTLIKETGMNRVVVASCSPRTHEPLFQETIREAGLNKYLFEMANIRDQNTWVHMHEPQKATRKAKDLVRMAVAKAAHIEPLHQVAVEVHKAALVIGGGLAGMEAALGVANQGCKVYLVEKTDRLGGVANQLRSTWQGENIKTHVTQMIDSVSQHKDIEVFMETRIGMTTGSLGNFMTTLVSEKDELNTTAIEHGVTILATGGREARPDQYMYGKHPKVLTHLDMDDALVHDDARLKTAKCAVFIQCVGSRTPERPYCSKICCTHSIKGALALKEKNPDMNVFVLYRDIRSYGFRENLFQQAREKGVVFIRYRLDDPPLVEEIDQDTISIKIFDPILGRKVDITAELLVLAAGIVPHDNKKLFELFKVPVNSEGFLVEAHAKLRPVDFASDGIFLAGLAHYPKPVEESIAQAKATASRAMSVLSKEAIMVGGVVATVNPDMCAVCLTCVRTCPYHAPYISVEGYAVIEPSKCHGCGACVAECPGKAIALQHFTDEQIIAKTDALFLAESVK